MDKPSEEILHRPAELSVQEFLEAKGYRHLIVDGERAYDPEYPLCEYRPGDLELVGVFRFEGASDPDDMSVIYAVEGPDGLRGAIVDAFGTYGSPDVARFIERVDGNSTRQERMQRSTTV